MMRPFIVAAICIALVGIAGGCASTSRPQGAGVSLKLYRETKESRITYFELQGGELSFGGGRLARQRVAKPAVKLTDDQLGELNALIDQHQLMNAKGPIFTGNFQNVRYEVTISRGFMNSNSFNCVDNDVPGAEALHDLLFKWQAAERYIMPELDGKKVR